MNLIVELTKYLMIFLIGIYTYYSFNVFRYKNKNQQDRTYRTLTVIIFALHFIGYFTLFLQIRTEKLVLLYGVEVILFILILALYRIFYSRLSRLLLRNMLMLLAIGFIVLTRLSFDKAVRQVAYVGVTVLLCLFVPYAMKALPWLKRFGWFYGMVGVLLLLVVLIIGETSYGATNWLNIGGFSIQPSEFVKLLFVFSIASMFREGTNFKRVIVISGMAAANVLILVVQKDLGGALLFFVTYIFMLYAATSKPLYLFGGLAAGSVAATIAYKLFYHVRVRVLAWKNPFGYIDKEGYQISQSLFAIGTGSWFGMGLNRGLPTSIPVVESDFIFSAIAEELGGLFALCIILIYISCFIMFINIALSQQGVFYRLLSIGFSVMFGFQVILSIGGVIKFIPSTGVTLPLISSGGSSAVTTILMFMILQGIYLRSRSEKKEMQETAAALETEELE
jgi:cell division protein FtsW (lipid II flippase)